jgi:hypothetical protein
MSGEMVNSRPRNHYPTLDNLSLACWLDFETYFTRPSYTSDTLRIGNLPGWSQPARPSGPGHLENPSTVGTIRGTDQYKSQVLLLYTYVISTSYTYYYY